jgi:hypothetical protein
MGESCIGSCYHGNDVVEVEEDAIELWLVADPGLEVRLSNNETTPPRLSRR